MNNRLAILLECEAVCPQNSLTPESDLGILLSCCRDSEVECLKLWDMEQKIKRSEEIQDLVWCMWENQKWLDLVLFSSDKVYFSRRIRNTCYLQLLEVSQGKLHHTLDGTLQTNYSAYRKIIQHEIGGKNYGVQYYNTWGIGNMKYTINEITLGTATWHGTSPILRDRCAVMCSEFSVTRLRDRL